MFSLQLKALDVQLQQLSDQQKGLQATADEIEQRVLQLNTEVSKMEVKRTHLKRRLEGARQELATAHRHESDLRRQADVAVVDLDKVQKSIADVATGLKALR